MSSPKILSQQKYFLSCLTTTLLIALTTQPSLAFSITPPRSGNTEVSYTLANQSRGTTRLSSLTSITRGGIIGFLGTLRRDFPTWTFNSAPNDLAGRFEIGNYNAIGEYSGDPRIELLGADLQFYYIPGIGDPRGSSLHWIQRVYSNHNSTGHGNYDDIIDNGSQVADPFYDTPGADGSIYSVPPYFEDVVRRPDLDKNHTWLAQLYLVEQTGPRQVTIYNGVQWGWENEVGPVPEQGVPEPLTMLGAATALGYGAILKRKFSKKTVP